MAPTYISYVNIYTREPLLKNHTQIVEFWSDRSDDELVSLARSKGIYDIDLVETSPLDNKVVEYLELWVIEKCLLGSGGVNNVNSTDIDEDAYLSKLANFYNGMADKQAAKISYAMLVGSIDEVVDTAKVYNRIR